MEKKSKFSKRKNREYSVLPFRATKSKTDYPNEYKK